MNLFHRLMNELDLLLVSCRSARRVRCRFNRVLLVVIAVRVIDVRVIAVMAVLWRIGWLHFDK